LRDWVFSRQRYWGEPIPLVNCSKCGWVAVPEDQLPLTLPEVSSYEPGADGESPLASLDEWVNTTCPCCGGKAERETDTMPQWAGSSWYFLRYCDPYNTDALASKEALNYWMPVDWYNGGMEHTTLHLLYSRFWSKFLYDEGILSNPEPYAKRTSHGMILGENGEKMSKSRGNVVNPDDIINEYGADTMRLYEMFIGDFEKAAPWSSQGIKGCKRFLDRYAAMCDLANGNGVTEKLESSFHKTIKKVTEDIDNLKANTAIAALMALINDIYDAGTLTLDELDIFTRLLCPFAPHIAEEVWENVLHKDGFCSLASWPQYDESKTVDSTVEIAVQICGKLKGTICLASDCDKDTALSAVKADERFAKLIEGKTIVKEIVVPGRLINIVVK
ncbi:MAG: class I tRNA ligase family protein, partial [Clostridia bacterium]|nr:class I tRNA ligase family protein [Clostridia bacterium]